MRLNDILHKGLWAECKTCNPPKEDEKKEFREKREKREMTPDLFARRLVNQEIGDDEATFFQRSMLLQKYGVSAPRIDKRVNRPFWITDQTWKAKLPIYFRELNRTGLVTRYQEKRRQNESIGTNRSSIRTTDGGKPRTVRQEGQHTVEVPVPVWTRNNSRRDQFYKKESNT
jgi:hypothetical protein